MNKKIVLLSALVLLTSCQALVVFDAQAFSSDGYTVIWAIDLPREVYFIGESVAFTVVAFVSSDPDILLPDQMAKITIRNGTLFEVFSAWVTTNANGSAPITWETGLDAATGNYTIILEDLADMKVVANFTVLFNEETYWQTRVDLLERDLQSQYEYINYLYSYNKYLNNRVHWIDQQFKLLWAMSFITVMCGIYVAMHEAAGMKRNTSGLMSYPSKLLEILGFRSRPIVELDHEEIANLDIPQNKVPPIYGHDQFCPVCDPQKKKPMTEGQLRDHLWAVHDRLHLKKDSIGAKWRARKAEGVAKAEKKAKEPVKPAFASVETYQKEWTEEKAKETFQARLDLIKKQHKKKLITNAQAKAKVAQVRADLEAVNRKPVVLKQTTAPKVELQRKVRMERQLSHVPKIPTGISQVSKKIPAETPSSESALDELFDKLNHEKVN
jgi:hypothetical protein